MAEPNLDESPIAILDRIAAGAHTDADLATLRRALLVGAQGNVVQIGKYNVRIDDAQGVHVGPRIYRGVAGRKLELILRKLLGEFLSPSAGPVDLRAVEQRYRDDVVWKYGRMDFTGLKADEWRPADVLLQDVFVSLSLSVWRSAAWPGSRTGEKPAGDQDRETETRQEEVAGVRSSGTMGTGGQGQKQERERRPEPTTPGWEPITLAEVLNQNSFIIGEPGAGKSTLLRWLAVTYAGKVGREGDGSALLPVTDRLPVYVELGRLPRPFLDPDEQVEPNWQMLPRYVAGQPEMNKASAACISDAAAHGRCLLLFDGLDEVTDREVRARLIRSIDRQFGGDNRIIIASRPSGLADVESAAPGGFQRCRIKRFTDEDIKRFIRNRYRLLEDLTEDEKQARADAFFDALRRSAGAMDLARTPLLAAILLRLQEDQGALPKQPVEIYERCCESLIKDWQLYRPSGYTGVFKNLSWERHLGLLAPLAYAIYAVSGRGSAPSDELAPPLSRALLAQGLTTTDVQAQLEAEQFLAALGLGSGLLQRQGENEYGFPHQTFQEYLVARYIAFQDDPNVTVDLVMEHLHEARWTHIHELVIGILCSRDATVDKAELLVRRILRVYPLPWWLLRPDHRVPGKLVPGFQLDRRLAYVLGREAELAARGCGAAVPNEKADRIRHEVEITCLDGLLRRQGQEPFARALGRLGVANRLVYDVLLLRLRSDDPDVVEAAARSLGQLGMITKEARDRLLETLNERYAEEEAQAAAARSLGEWGLADAEIVGALMRAADQKHYEILRQSSASSLVRIAGSDPTVKDAIVEVLRGQRSYKRMALIRGLGELERADPDIVQTLISALGRDGREAAVESLVRLGERDAQVAEALLQPLRSHDAEMRRAAAEALGRLGRTNPAVPGMLVEALGDHFGDVSWGAVVALVEIINEKPEVADRLLGAFRSDNARVRLRAIQILGRLSLAPSWATEALIGSLRDVEPPVREAAAQTLGKREDWSREAVSPLVGACSDDYYAVRVAAVSSLGELRGLDHDALETVISVLEGTTDPKAREAAAAALGRLARPSARAVGALIAALTDRNGWYDDADVRGAAAYSLGQLGLASPDVIAALARALRAEGDGGGEEARVREAAACSLGWLGKSDPVALDALLDALGDKDFDVRAAAIGSLALIGDADSRVVDALVAALEDDGDRRTSRGAAISLGFLGAGSAKVTAELLAAISEWYEDERQAAACSLARLANSDPEVKKELLARAARGAKWTAEGAAAALCLSMMDLRSPEVIDALIWLAGGGVRWGTEDLAGRQLLALAARDSRILEACIRLSATAPNRHRRHEMTLYLDELAEEILGGGAPPDSGWPSRWAEVRVAAKPGSVPITVAETWVGSLGDASWCVRWEAATALGKFPLSRPDALTALEQRLSDDEVLVQLAAVTSLRWRGEASPAAIETIKGFLRHEDPGLREAVAESLGHFDSGDPRTIDALLQSFQSDAVVAVREAAARSLGLLANGDLPVAGALCSVLVNTGENAGLRAAAATGMGWISDASDEILAALFGALADENAGVSYAAGLALAEVGQARSDVVHQLVTLMDSENPSTRRGAVAGLASNVEEDRAKAGVLLRAVRDPDASVRYIALKSLASMDHVDLEVRRTLVRGLSDDNREIRDEAAGALARHGKTDTEILDTVFDLLGYADADIREAVCRGLALLGAAAPQQAADALRVALHDSNERVRYAAVEGLGLLGQPDAKTVAELLPFLSHPEEEAPQYRAEECRRAAIRSLARLGHFRPEIVEELLGEFASTDSFHDEEWDEAFAALVALAKASPEAVGALHEALHASNQNVRRGAGRCLAELGYTTPAIVRDLIEDALQHRTGSREPLHERVVERLVQLGRADSEITEQIIRAFAKKHNNDFSGMLTGILGQIGYRQPAAVSSLLTAAHDPDRNRPEWVIEALGQVGQGSSEVIGALAEKLRDPERSIRLAAERSLGQLNIDVEAQLRSALIALNRALHDKDEDVRREALASLRKFLNGRPIPGYCWKPITAKREQQD